MYCSGGVLTVELMGGGKGLESYTGKCLLERQRHHAAGCAGGASFLPPKIFMADVMPTAQAPSTANTICAGRERMGR